MAGQRTRVQHDGDEVGDISRRDFVAWSLTAALAASVRTAANAQSPVTEANVG
jgi:hypothetical protein